MGIRIFIILLFFGVASSEKLTCTADEFRCSNGERCLGKAFVCDEFANCLDKSDEDPVLCETWEYDYTDESEDSGGWGWGGWGGETEEEEDYTEDKDYDYTNEVDDDKTSLDEDKTSLDDDKTSLDDDESTDDFDDFDDEQVSGFEDPFDNVKFANQRCSPNHCMPQGPLQFVDGQEYLYSYEMSSKTQALRENDNQTSSFLISTDVKIQVLTACEMYLKVENIVSKSSTPDSNGEAENINENNQFLGKIANEPLRFSMVGGEVDTVCPSTKETSNSLNFKKAIISMLQNTMPKLHLSHSQKEKDIVGECQIQYTYEGSNGQNVVVSKSRDTQSCHRRSHISSAASGSPYDFPTNSDPLSVIDTKSKCTQEIRSGMIRDASCIETHDLVPFSADQSGVQAVISQKLNLVSESSYSAQWRSVDKRDDLQFDQATLFSKTEDLVNKLDINEVLDQVSTIYENDYQETEYPASLFKKLIILLRQMSYEEIKNIKQSRDWKETDLQYFHDAIGMLGTSASITFIATELKTNGIKSTLANSWISSIAFIQSPNLEMITALSDLLEVKDKHPEILMHAGSLLHNFCSLHQSCALLDPVKAVMNKYLSIVRSNCNQPSRVSKVEVLMALRGLGNAGQALNKDLLSAMNQCILEDKNEVEIVSTAIEAFRRVPCNESRISLQEILYDNKKDSELRILSYLGLMKCVDYKTLHLVENLLMTEEVNQVGSFIWTHLTNLQESSSTQKYQIQSLLSNRQFAEKFKSDFRKFSKNIEWSGFYEAMNVGSSFESNIIFSQKSYIPRITTFNLTADLFGRSFNFLEVGTRIEGLERYIEQLIRGEHPRMERNSINSRSINNLIEMSGRRKEYIDSEPKVSFHMKTFGNDVLYHQMQSVESVVSKLKNLNMQNIIEYLETGKEFTLEKASMPLETTYSLATCSGFPLRINIDGAASVDLSANLKMDVTGIMRGKAMLKGHLKPSLSVDLKASMTLDSGSLTSGIEIDSSLFSSTLIDGKIEIDGKNAVSVDFNLPQDKIKILRASSKMSIIHGNSKPVEYPSKGVSLQREAISSPSVPLSGSEQCLSFNENFGFRICSSNEFPDLLRSSFNHRMLLNGPMKVSLDLRKMDVSLKSYKFRYRFVNDEKESFIQLLYDTPQSTINREHSVSFGINYATLNAYVSYRTPSRSFEAKGNYKCTPENKRLNASVIINGEEEATIIIGYKIHSKGGQNIVIPVLQIDRKSIQLFKLSGDLQARERGSGEDSIHYSVDLNFEVETATDGVQKGRKGRGVIGGYVNKENFNWELNLDASYTLGSSETNERINIYYKREMQGSETPVKMLSTWRVSFSQFPYLNTKGNWASKVYGGSIENSIQASFGRDFANPLHQVDIYHNFILYGGHKPVTFNSTIAVKYPLKNVDIILGLDLYHDFKDLITGFIFQYSTGEALTSRFHLIRNIYGPLEMEGSFYFLIPGLADWRFNGKVSEKGIHIYKFEFDGSLSARYQLELSGDYTDLSTRLRALHNLEMKLKVPFTEAFYTNLTLLYDSNQIALVSQITTKDGSIYKLRLAYMSRVDDFFARHQRIEIDLHLPTSIYYWHSDISFGEYFTMSNDIHIDRYRDIGMWLQVMNTENKPTSVELNFLWDANRDPQKKANFKLTIEDRRLDLGSFISFLNNEYRASWTSVRKWADEGNWLNNWTQDHAGELSWKENRREIHKITFGASFELIRSNGATLNAKVYLTTPLETWKNNSLRIEYTRSAEEILAVMNMNWHRDEFLNLKFYTGLTTNQYGRRADFRVEVLSLINDNVVTFIAGTHLQKMKNIIDGKIFVQWDKDEVQFIIEAANQSGPHDIKGTVLAKVLTTLEGYSHLSTFVDAYASSTSVTLLGTAKWEEVLYELKCNGDLHTAKEYLIGEVSLHTPQYGPETVYTKIRVYHDAKSHDEMLMIMGQWINKEFSVNGRVGLKEDFQAKLDIDVPFEKLSQASLSIGFSTNQIYMGEVWLKWNRTKDLGLRVISRTSSLTDFLISLALKTPLPKFKDVNIEIRNLFQLSPDVRVNSRIFGQLDAKKYGLGCRYEQGTSSPKLRVGLEIYYPSLDLEEVKFDIADNSTLTNVRYDFELRHGRQRQININTDFMQTDTALEFSLGSGITLVSDEGSIPQKINLNGEAKFHWTTDTDFQIRLETETGSERYQISTKGLLKPDKSLKVEGALMTPLDGYKDLDYTFNLKRTTQIQKGKFNIKINSERMTLLMFDVEGTFKDVSVSFQSPWEGYRKGSVEYKLDPQDIIKSRVNGKATLEDNQIGIHGVVYLNNKDDITNLDLSLSSTIEGYESMKLILEGRDERDGFKNLIKFEVGGDTFDGEIFYRISADQDLMVMAKIQHLVDGILKEYKFNVEYQNVEGRPFVLDLEFNGPTPEYITYALVINIQSLSRPYDLTLEWDTPVSSGNLEVNLESFNTERIYGTIAVALENSDEEFETYKVKADFKNQSSRDKVDVSLFTEITSSHQQWNYILVNGVLTQITNEPGVLHVYLVWPELRLVNFTARAKYVDEPFNLRTDINLNLTTANYGFLGEVNKDGIITMNGGLWWQKGPSEEIQKVRVTTTIENMADGFHSLTVLNIPMAKGLESSRVDVTYKKRGEWKDVNVNIEAGNMKTNFVSLVKVGAFPLAEGNATITSSMFREGNPLTLTFSQTSTSDGFIGEYDLGWPVWNLKTREYRKELLKANLNHHSIYQGKEGVLKLFLPVTKGKPISLSYSFQLPKIPDFTVKFGIGYENIEFGFKVTHVVTRTLQDIRRKTSFELDNLIWPFGIAYLETTPLTQDENNGIIDKVIIYDLYDTDRRSSVTFSKNSNEEGGKISIMGALVERELELSIGYKKRRRNYRANLNLSWSESEKIEINIDFEDKSHLDGKDFLFSAKVAHPLRAVLLKGSYKRNTQKLLADLILNTDLHDYSKLPVNIVIDVQKNIWNSDQKNINGIMRVSHPTLVKDIMLSIEAESTILQPVLLNLHLQYSNTPEEDLYIKALVERSRKFLELTDHFEIKHSASNLLAKMEGNLLYRHPVCSFNQNLEYSKENGERHSAKLHGKLDMVEKSLITQVESTQKILDLNVKIGEVENGHWKLTTVSETHSDSLPTAASFVFNPNRPGFVLTIDNSRNQNETLSDTAYDYENPRYHAEQIVIEGGYEDERYAYAVLRHQEKPQGNPTEFWVQDLVFVLKLNNSKLLFSSLNWRKSMEEELKNELKALTGITKEFRADFREWIRNTAIAVGAETFRRAKPIARSTFEALKPLMLHLKNETRDFRRDFVTLFSNINLTKNEKHLRDSVQFAVSSIAKTLGELKFVKRVKAALAQGTLRAHITNLITKIKEFYNTVMKKEKSFGKIVEKLKEFASRLAAAYDHAAKQWYLTFRNTMEDFKMRLNEWLRKKWHKLYYDYKPHILKTLHHIESASYTMVTSVWDMMKRFGANFKSLTFVQNLEEIYQKLKTIYKEMSERSLRDNIEFVYSYVSFHVAQGFKIFVERVFPFIEDWMNEINNAWIKFNSYDNVNNVVQFLSRILRSVYEGAMKIDYREYFIEAAAFLVENGRQIISQTAVKAHMSRIESKTDMNWKPNEGEIKLVQKLPFVWNSFYRSPDMEEMLEIPYISALRKRLFRSAETSLLDTWFRHFNFIFEPRSWFPPFPATGYLVGNDHLITFDGKLLSYNTSCEHLLAADIIYRQWAATVKYNEYAPKTINIYVDGRIVEFSKQFKVKVDRNIVTLPLTVGPIYLWRSDAAVHLVHKNSMKLTWNMVHDVVSLTLPKETFLNTAGLLGTNNNEPIDDLQAPDGSVLFSSEKSKSSSDVLRFLESWKVNDNRCYSTPTQPEQPLLEVPSICDTLFMSPNSPFKYCFSRVDPLPYYNMCINSYRGSKKDSSSSALAYREKCNENFVPIKLPVDYVRCEYINGTTGNINKLKEGQTITLRKNEVEKAIDVVLLIELKSCNQEKLQSKEFQRFVTMFSDGMKKEGIRSIRFALVVFGGSGMNRSPSVVSFDSEIFTGTGNILRLMENLEFMDEEDESNMIDYSTTEITFTAITYASNLAFRSPVNVVFALFPCTACAETHGFDYSTMYHIIKNNAATLYVFKNDYFDIEKESARKKIIGYDKEKAYMIKDYKKNKMGNSALKNQIKPPKQELNLCLPLAIETGGAVFTSELLLGPKKRIDRYGILAGRRAAQDSHLQYDQRCLCLSTAEVAPLLRCEKWEMGDFSVLERYGLNEKPRSFFKGQIHDYQENYYE